MSTDVHHYFPRDKFNIKSSEFEITDPEGKLCVNFSVGKKLEDGVSIEDLSKCGNVSGTEVLQNVVQYARNLGPPIKEACLRDGSKINLCPNEYNDFKITVPLYLLNILSKGESWYNLQGFKSSSYTHETEHNRNFISRPLGEVFVDTLSNELSDEAYDNTYRYLIANRIIQNQTEENKKGAVLQKFYHVLTKILKQNEEVIQTQSVREVFTKIKLHLTNNQSNCSKDFVLYGNMISFMIDILEPYIEYHAYLCKNIIENEAKRSREGGFKTKRRKTRKAKTKQKRKRKVKVKVTRGKRY